MPPSSRFILPVLSLLTLTPVEASDPPAGDGTSMTAVVESSMPTASRQIRQFAFDGDTETYFASANHPGGGDHFTLVLDRPVPVSSIAVVTGRPDGSDTLDAGAMEVSDDGIAFAELAKFADGSARGDAKGRSIRAIRVRPTSDLTHPLVIREIQVDSAEPVATFGYPVEFAVDVTDAPEMKEWAEKAARLCERWYPKINEALKSEGHRPRTYVSLVLSGSSKGVAMAGGGKITGSVRFFKKNPDDLGAMIHETVHIAQGYRNRNNPSWLVEGVADYYRFFVYEPGKAGPVNPKRAHYNGCYRTTATFLAYLADEYDDEIVFKLNTLMREGRYKKEAFEELTGETLQELDEEWLASLRK